MSDSDMVGDIGNIFQRKRKRPTKKFTLRQNFEIQLGMWLAGLTFDWKFGDKGVKTLVGARRGTASSGSKGRAPVVVGGMGGGVFWSKFSNKTRKNIPYLWLKMPVVEHKHGKALPWIHAKKVKGHIKDVIIATMAFQVLGKIGAAITVDIVASSTHHVRPLVAESAGISISSTDLQQRNAEANKHTGLRTFTYRLVFHF